MCHFSLGNERQAGPTRSSPRIRVTQNRSAPRSAVPLAARDPCLSIVLILDSLSPVSVKYSTTSLILLHSYLPRRSQVRFRFSSRASSREQHRTSEPRCSIPQLIPLHSIAFHCIPSHSIAFACARRSVVRHRRFSRSPLESSCSRTAEAQFPRNRDSPVARLSGFVTAPQ